MFATNNSPSVCILFGSSASTIGRVVNSIDGPPNQVQPSANAVCQLVWPIFLALPCAYELL